MARGFAAIGVIIALSILAAMAAGLAELSATNQVTRYQQLEMDQAFLSTNAAFEYTLRQIQVDGDPNPIPSRDFAGSALSINRTSQKIKVAVTKNHATSAYSITDPNPPTMANCLIVNTSNAGLSSNKKKLQGITVQMKTSKCTSIVMTAMIISWTPNGGEKVVEIDYRGDAQKEYHNEPTGQASGTTFVFQNTYTMTDGTVDDLKFVRWQTGVNTSTHVTLTFIMQDASTKTVTI